ncbi:hypothetical protein FQR65_LT03178 [Abscondita terminalis]|nr:hypothetical protein FQR65_LT03178 [Abscondita terminalis]
MDFLLMSLIFSMVVKNVFALPSVSENHREKREEFDLDDAESFVHSLTALPLENNVPQEFLDASALPHEDLHGFSSYIPPASGYVQGDVHTTYGVPAPAPVHVQVPVHVPAPVHVPVAVPAPAVGVTVNKYAVLAPHLEIFRFLEAFVQFKNELIARLQQLINNNWDLILSIINFVLSKLQNLQGVFLILISFVRQILEFGLSLFSQFSINLPSVSVGVSGHADPLPSFNLNSVISAASGWLSG